MSCRATAHHGQREADYKLDPFAEYIVLFCDSERLALEFGRISYEIVALRRIYRERGRRHAGQVLAQLD